jgi:hypothetical protein
VAEWFKAPVLKTGRGEHSLVGSNPTPSARSCRRTFAKAAKNPHKICITCERAVLLALRAYADASLSWGYDRGYSGRPGYGQLPHKIERLSSTMAALAEDAEALRQRYGA